MLFDSTIVLFLLWRRTRPFAYVVVVGFHVVTFVLFPIGMFPFIMVTAALVFFDPSWPRALIARVRRLPATVRPSVADQGAPPAAPGWKGRVALGAALVYAFLQVVLPLRTHAYGGNVLWHEQGMRFSWRVMTREKNGSATFMVRDSVTGRQWHVPPSQYLTRLQEREMAVQPDLILQLAHQIARDYEATTHHPVEVRADVRVSLNGRMSEPLVDPTVDLAREEDGLGPKAWILPAPEGPPVHLRPTRSARAGGPGA
ncbi:hypothetical protein D7X32_11890 [Corallococcus carmarthensis]|uniref:Uncharacterized protein n=2 Tax=Corallococcus carmarthensis TaxID=2316728 RepID=A0A3A8K7V3_9BACT|nr:hypothetical protein D7X32_11890 [Corallococcus carmarthensis]